jgi:hypothetical protein
MSSLAQGHVQLLVQAQRLALGSPPPPSPFGAFTASEKDIRAFYTKNTWPEAWVMPYVALHHPSGPAAPRLVVHPGARTTEVQDGTTDFILLFATSKSDPAGKVFAMATYDASKKAVKLWNDNRGAPKLAFTRDLIVVASLKSSCFGDHTLTICFLGLTYSSAS